MWNKIYKNPGWLLIIASLIVVSLHFTQMGINLDSTTYSVVARNMLETGRWLSPTYTEFYYKDFAQHPPFVMWIQAVVFKILGANDITARLFGVFCVIGSIFLVFLIGKKIKDENFGFIAGLILLLTPNFITFGNSTLLDGPMTFFILFAIYWWIVSCENSKSIVPFLLWGGSAGLAFLTKGLAILPVYAGILLGCLLIKQNRENHKFYLGLLVSFSIPAVYIIIENLFGQGVFTDLYFKNQIGGAVNDVILKSEIKYFKYPVKFISQYYLPWSLFFLYGIYVVIKRKAHLFFLPLIIQILYFSFYSVAPRVYSHYYMPSYGLGCILAALPIYEIFIKKNWNFESFRSYFLSTLLIISVVIQLIPIRFQYIRRPYLVKLTPVVKKWNDNFKGDFGLSIGKVDWGLVAKAKWYWNTDILFVNNLENAIEKLNKDKKFGFIIVKNTEITHDIKSKADLLEKNSKYSIIVSKGNIVKYTRPYNEFPTEWIR